MAHVAVDQDGLHCPLKPLCGPRLIREGKSCSNPGSEVLVSLLRASLRSTPCWCFSED